MPHIHMRAYAWIYIYLVHIENVLSICWPSPFFHIIPCYGLETEIRRSLEVGGAAAPEHRKRPLQKTNKNTPENGLKTVPGMFASALQRQGHRPFRKEIEAPVGTIRYSSSILGPEKNTGKQCQDNCKKRFQKSGWKQYLSIDNKNKLSIGQFGKCLNTEQIRNIKIHRGKDFLHELTHTHIHICIYIYICIYLYTCVSITWYGICIHVHIYSEISVQLNIHTRIHTHAHANTAYTCTEQGGASGKGAERQGAEIKLSRVMRSSTKRSRDGSLKTDLSTTDVRQTVAELSQASWSSSELLRASVC